MANTGMPRCPRNCDREYVERWPNMDTEHSIAYACMACGTVFHLNRRIMPRSEERQLWKDKYGEDN